MKLYTCTDLERAARLGIIFKLDGFEVRDAVSQAVKTIVDDSPLFYSKHVILDILKYALVNGTADGDVEKLFEEALERVSNLRQQ